MSLRSLIDKIKPNFQKGGKLEKLHSTFDALETFLFVPNKVTTKGSQIRDAVDLKRIMSIVIFALVPALLWGMFNVGYQHARAIGEVDTWTWLQMFGFGAIKVLPIVVVSYASGLGVEFIAAQIRGHEVNEGFLVSGMLIPLIMPVDAPLWMVAVSTIFAVIFGKEVFGGTGMNIFNPALIARAFMFFAYPSKISGDFVWIAGLSEGKAAGIVDGFSGATPLANAKAEMIDKLPSLHDLFFGLMPGSIGETSKFAILIGAIILIWTGVASWRIMLSVFAGGAVMGLIGNAIGLNAYMELPFYYHFVLGGFAFGAVFMATDPVTGTQTEKGKWIYGFLIGFMAVLIRIFNPAYPEGMMLSILLMNTFAPLIDHYVVEANIKRRLKRAKVNA